jgi:hypothetical protein
LKVEDIVDKVRISQEEEARAKEMKNKVNIGLHPNQSGLRYQSTNALFGIKSETSKRIVLRRV